MRCGRPLSRDEIGLHKKMINRGATTYMCLSCLAAYFDVGEQKLKDQIEVFRKSGCLLFQ